MPNLVVDDCVGRGSHGYFKYRNVLKSRGLNLTSQVDKHLYQAVD
jgi:hypothetical protein